MLTVGVSVVVFAPPHTLVAPSTILHGCVWPAVVPMREKVPTTDVALMAGILHVPAAWSLNDCTTALAEAGGPCTNGGEKYAPKPSFAAALTWLVGPGLKTTLDPATNRAMATATVRRRVKERVPDRGKLSECIIEDIANCMQSTG